MVFLAAFALVAICLRRSPERDLLMWDRHDVVADGRSLYAEHCASCHGAHLEGQSRRTEGGALVSQPLAPPHNASGHTWQHPDFVLLLLTKIGAAAELCRPLDERLMPKFEHMLTDDEIVAILSYIKSTWPDYIRAQQDSINRVYAPQNAGTNRARVRIPA